MVLSPILPGIGILARRAFLACLCLFVFGQPASAVPVVFPSATSTFTGSPLFFFQTGESVSETFTIPSLSAVTSADFNFTIGDFLNSGAFTTFDVSINGITIGSFTQMDQASGDYGFVESFGLFAPIAPVGNDYTIAFTLTNTVPGGQGSVTFGGLSFLPGTANLVGPAAGGVPEISASTSVMPLTLLFVILLLIQDRRKSVEGLLEPEPLSR